MKKLIVIVLFVALLVPMAGYTAPYGKEGLETSYTQPDGSVIELRVFGDEFYAVTETVGGYVLVFDPGAKTYYYAVLSSDSGELISSGIPIRAGDQPAKLGLKKNIRISKAARKEKTKKNF